KEKPQRGKVVAVGTGRVAEDGKVTPLSLKAGDEILYGKYSGTELSYDGKDYLIMRESDIYAVLN
ncbi:MAG TPA: co-chaperone GroES, partial [Flavobacteriales bacterium]|nr:co-chaperone GroES [Flavobacteriales bacterium]